MHVTRSVQAGRALRAEPLRFLQWESDLPRRGRSLSKRCVRVPVSGRRKLLRQNLQASLRSEGKLRGRGRRLQRQRGRSLSALRVGRALQQRSGLRGRLRRMSEASDGRLYPRRYVQLLRGMLPRGGVQVRFDSLHLHGVRQRLHALAGHSLEMEADQSPRHPPHSARCTVKPWRKWLNWLG